MTEYVLTLRCPDTSGIVHAVASGLLDTGANILEQAQFTDPDLNLFCLLTRFETPETDTTVVRDAITSAVRRFDPVITLRKAEVRRRVLVMVSKFDHCLVDLLYRWKTGELPIDIPLIVSNHDDLRPIAEAAGIPFEHIPVTPDSKSGAEQHLLRLVAEQDIDVVVLARYMQVLSDDLCSKLSGQVINIHHSFLPGFKGGRPVPPSARTRRQADRGDGTLRHRRPR